MRFPNQLSSQSTSQVLETQRNTYGLYRRYFSHQFPSHDPECEEDPLSPSNNPYSNVHPSTYSPYPNFSSFRLGDWYWNHGIQKSQSSFKELVSIVGDI